jgi:hypothetical protein
MKTEPINKESFDTILKDLKAPQDVDGNFLYDVYVAVIGGINVVMNQATNYQFIPVNHVVVILYILNEYFYSTHVLKTNGNISESEELSNGLASVCCDKYLTNEQLNYRSAIYLNKFNPQISTLSLYLNFTMTTLERIQVDKNDQISDLIKRMLKKAFSLSKCILDLLVNGFETEAFSTWRTLHENESILTCLMLYKEPMFNEYFKHITYALAYRHQMSQEDQDKIFERIKAEMKLHDLKSKDMKKYIEYGYLYIVPDFEKNGMKLNFRDGVEKAAGLSSYAKFYEMSSEIAHSSPLLLLSEQSYFLNLTLINLYESFFRLEKIFASYFETYSTKENFERYSALKKVYMNQLMIIYHKTKEEFLKTMASKNPSSDTNNNETNEESSE